MKRIKFFSKKHCFLKYDKFCICIKRNAGAFLV